MPPITATPASTRPRVRWRASIAALAMVVAGCSHSSAGSPAAPGSRADGSDRASQPLEAVVVSSVAPTSGKDAGVVVRVARWVGEHRRDRCGGPGPFAGDGDRFDQALFPDFEVIATEGLGLGRTLTTPPGPVEPADEACTASTLAEAADADEVFGQWMETVVYPTWTEDEIMERADESAACLRDRMGWDAESLPNLDAFLPALDGQATHWASQEPADLEEQVAALDRRASDAFADCAATTYEAFTARLEAERIPFLERHDETITAFAMALDDAGYVP